MRDPCSNLHFGMRGPEVGRVGLCGWEVRQRAADFRRVAQLANYVKSESLGIQRDSFFASRFHALFDKIANINS